MAYNDPPWIPITDPVDLKHLGKLAEELGECSAAVARCIIQGMDGKEPITQQVNRDWLQDEIADVIANIDLVIEHFKLNDLAILTRSKHKKAKLKEWHNAAKSVTVTVAVLAPRYPIFDNWVWGFKNRLPFSSKVIKVNKLHGMTLIDQGPSKPQLRIQYLGNPEMLRGYDIHTTQYLILGSDLFQPNALEIMHDIITTRGMTEFHE